MADYLKSYVKPIKIENVDEYYRGIVNNLIIY